MPARKYSWEARVGIARDYLEKRLPASEVARRWGCPKHAVGKHAREGALFISDPIWFGAPLGFTKLVAACIQANLLPVTLPCADRSFAVVITVLADLPADRLHSLPGVGQTSIRQVNEYLQRIGSDIRLPLRIESPPKRPLRSYAQSVATTVKRYGVSPGDFWKLVRREL